MAPVQTNNVRNRKLVNFSYTFQNKSYRALHLNLSLHSLLQSTLNETWATSRCEIILICPLWKVFKLLFWRLLSDILFGSGTWSTWVVGCGAGLRKFRMQHVSTIHIGIPSKSGKSNMLTNRQTAINPSPPFPCTTWSESRPSDTQ